MAGSVSPSIDHLEETWRSIDELCSTLSDADWSRPTGCPGWTVLDNLSHLVDYESRALGRQPGEHEPPDGDHLKNDLGRANEIGVDLRRSRPPAAVLDEFREVTASRLAKLRALGPDDLERTTWTPVGEGTIAQMLTLRVMDNWSHEQDIRRAVGRPGHDEGGAVTETVEYFAQFLPLVVGKRASAPDGSAIVVEIGSLSFVIEVEGGRARFVDPAEPPAQPTVRITVPPTTFAALVGGRSDAPDDATVEGDVELGRRILATVGFMP